MAFSPDGRSILTGGDDKTVRLWAVEPGQPVGRSLNNGAPVFSPDGKAILVAGRIRQGHALGHRVGSAHRTTRHAGIRGR